MNLSEKWKTRLSGWSGADLLYAAGVLLLIGISIARIFPTYTIFTQTFDEPWHIQGGIEWLDKGARSFPMDDPPLGQALVALGPYLKGLRGSALDPVSSDPWKTGTEILYSDGDYWHNLRLARLGILPFLVLACAVIFLWGRRWFSAATGFWSVLLFVSVPPILGHAGLATADVAGAATNTFALYQLMRWLENPVRRRSIGLGIALGLAFITRFSSIGFVAVCGTAAIAYLVVARRDGPIASRRFQLPVRQACLTGCVALVVLSAGYRFSFGPLSPYFPSANRRLLIDRQLESRPVLLSAVHKAWEVPIPLPELAKGLLGLAADLSAGHLSYLLGETRRTGWWYFFPIVVGVKTPIGFLLLAIAGIAIVLRRVRSGPWQQWLTALFPIMIMLVCVPSKMNIGVRHILPIYPLLALMAGHAVTVSFQNRRRILAVVSVLLVCTVVADSWLAHPDYMAWFNQLAQGHPERIVAVSDLDWGQDLNRLSQRLNALGVKEVAIQYFGTASLEKASLPPYRILSRDKPTTGYVAISVRDLFQGYASTGAYGWLKQRTPLETVGKSIYLYHIDDRGTPAF